MDFTSSFYGAGDVYSAWRTISILAAAVSVIGATVLIMLSRLFDLRNLEQVAKTEFVFAVSTVLIVLLVLGIIGVGEKLLANGENGLARCLYLSSFGCNDCNAIKVVYQQSTLIDWMMLYMSTATSCVKDFMYLLYTMAIPVEGIASIFMEIFMSEHASGFGVKWIAERITNTTQSLTFYMYAFYVLKEVLTFVKAYSGFFFSIGVALRAFPPTRGAGAYLMAISFGLYFVFPLTYILIASMSMPYSQSAIMVPDLTPGQSAQLQSGQAGSTVSLQCQQADAANFKFKCLLPAAADVSQYSCQAPSEDLFWDFVSWFKGRYQDFKDVIFFRINEMTRMVVSSVCLFPLVAFVVLLTFVLNTTNLFGGNIPEIGRGLVKLI